MQSIDNPLFAMESVPTSIQTPSSSSKRDPTYATVDETVPTTPAPAPPNKFIIFARIGVISLAGLLILAFAIYAPVAQSELKYNRKLKDEYQTKYESSIEQILNMTHELYKYKTMYQEAFVKAETAIVEVFNLKEELETANKTLIEAEKKVEKYIEMYEDEKNRGDHEEAKSNELEIELEDAKGQLTEAQQTIADQKHQLDAQQEGEHKLKMQIKELQKNQSSNLEKIFELNEALVNEQANTEAAEKKLDEVETEKNQLISKNLQLTTDLQQSQKTQVKLLIQIKKLKYPHIECSVETKLCYRGTYNDNATFDEAISSCEFEQWGRKLAEPQTRDEVLALLDMVKKEKHSNVLLGIVRAGDKVSWEFIREGSKVTETEWGIMEPKGPESGEDTVVMTTVDDDTAWFTADKNSKNFNYICQEPVESE